MLSHPNSVVLLLTITTTLVSSFAVLPSSDRVPSLLDLDILSSAQPDNLDVANEATLFHTLSTLNLPILSQEQTIQLTRLTNNLDLNLSLTTSTSHLLRRSSLATSPGGSALLRSTGSTFLALINLGTQSFNVVIDSGSSDTWVSRSDFTCVDVTTGNPRPQSACAFGGTYSRESISTSTGNTFKQLNNVNFNVTYGDGEFLTGIFGTIDVTFAGIKTPNQQVALATVAGWNGDGISSGILGLAFPALTGAYAGSDPNVDRYCWSSPPSGSANGCNQVEFPPLLTNTFSQNLTSALFAVALSRDESRSGKGGYLSVGGVMDLKTVGVISGARFASTPVRMLQGDGKYRYYLVNVDGILTSPVGSSIPQQKRVVKDYEDDGNGNGSNTGEEVEIQIEEEELSDAGGRGMGGRLRRRDKAASSQKTTTSTRATSASTLPGTLSLPIIIDTGTTISFLPRQLIERYLSMFSPPGTYDPTTGFWFVNCNAQVPPLGVKIGGKAFWHNPKDLIKRYDQSGRCISSVQESTGLGINILGDVWLDSVLVVFDLRNPNKRMVRVAARRDYAS